MIEIIDSRPIGFEQFNELIDSGVEIEKRRLALKQEESVNWFLMRFHTHGNGDIYER
ncbi:hypothetical protein MYOV011v1_p0358 [Vibrio phage 6E35.1a]|nr:hypothetical protein MYOV011v1_p0358 [Vibrio phage 6E35.1a]